MDQEQSPQFLNILDYSSQLLQDLNQCLGGLTLWVRDRGSQESLSLEMQETASAIILQAQFHTQTHSLAVRVNPEAVLIQGKRWEPSYRPALFDPGFFTCRFQRLISLPSLIQSETAIAKLNGNQLTVTLWKSHPVPQHILTQISDRDFTV